MADGCVSKVSKFDKQANRLTINISNKDKQILEFIKKELECDYKILDYIPKNTYSDNIMSKITINSKKICYDLSKYGVIPNKTTKEIFPDIDESMKRHFLRGFLDGDGCIYCTREKKMPIISFESNKRMLEDISIWLNKNGVKKISNPQAEYRVDKSFKNLYKISYNSACDINILKKLLYEDAYFFLKRKKIKLDNINANT